MHASPLPYPHLHQTHTILYIKVASTKKNLPAQINWGLAQKYFFLDVTIWPRKTFSNMRFLGYYDEIQGLLNTFKFKIELNYRFYESAKQLVRCASAAGELQNIFLMLTII